MGTHYVPQKYLEGFSDANRPGFVWLYDKKHAKFSDDSVAIKRVAQQRGFYDTDIEKKLNDLVEIPGNEVIGRLRSNVAISDKDRASLSVYIATMIHRVPRHRERAREPAPTVLTNVVSQLKEQIRATAKSKGIDDSVVEQHFAVADATEEKLRQIPPSEVIPGIRIPQPSERTVRLIYNMTWRFVVADPPSFFLTSDNPAFFFECYGLQQPKSELTFPICSNLALFGSWIPVRGRIARIHSRQLVNEANRRVAIGASRFVFSGSKALWIPKIASKGVEHLNLIRW